MKLSERKIYCTTRLTDIRNRISGIPEIKNLDNFCIYATGSYARNEASKFSDLDMFFIYSDDSAPISKISKTLVDAELIKMVRSLNLPDFSGDGTYLQIHSVGNLIKELGSTDDDYKNYFTARLLLLLESTPLYNEKLYNQAVEQIVERYFVDYKGHEQNFLPIFLTNDIIRFWKTLTINYEHKRLQEEEKEIEKNKGHYKNLKLKFSRKLTCFSFVLQILSIKGVITPKDVVGIIKMTPTERLENLKLSDSAQKKTIMQILDLYNWFLNEIDKPKDELYKWIGEKDARDDAFEKSRQFADAMYDLMKNNDNGLLKYLIV